MPITFHLLFELFYIWYFIYFYYKQIQNIMEEKTFVIIFPIHIRSLPNQGPYIAFHCSQKIADQEYQLVYCP